MRGFLVMVAFGLCVLAAIGCGLGWYQTGKVGTFGVGLAAALYLSWFLWQRVRVELADR